jgi:NAD(P)-dependent dehydrogenase (short-subunit alcohol dehydrogenase family)
MIERGEGYFLNTASAAGLLNQIGDAAYSTTKHAAVGFAEALAITHGDDGIRVSCLCPQAVATRMIGAVEDGGTAGVDGVLPPVGVADAVVAGARRGALPDPAPSRSRHLSRAQDRGLRPLARRHAQIASSIRQPYNLTI